MPEPDRALSHIKVIDLCRARSGPTCVRQLSEMGAQVIKVEALVSDDDGTGVRHGFDFQNVHPNKRSITLNLKHPEGRDILMRMVPDADVVVENFRPDVKFRLGIDYETLAKINPRLVYGSISGFGQTGPYRDRPGLDQIAQGLSGLMTVNGDETTPGECPFVLLEHRNAHQVRHHVAKAAIVIAFDPHNFYAALWAGQFADQGEKVPMLLLETAEVQIGEYVAKQNEPAKHRATQHLARIMCEADLGSEVQVGDDQRIGEDRLHALNLVHWY